MTRARLRVGLIAPAVELPGEYEDAAADLEALTWTVISDVSDAHTHENLEHIGSSDVLAVAAKRLERWRPDVVMWACTSGSFVQGRTRSIEQSRLLAEQLGVPASSTSLAFVEALTNLGEREVAVLGPYPAPITERFERFLDEWGITVRRATSLDQPGGRDSMRLTSADLVRHLDSLGTGVVLLPDTAVWGLELLGTLGQRDRGQTLLVANQVTLWQAMRLGGRNARGPSLGVLSGR